MKKFLIFIFFSLVLSDAFSQNVQLKGTVTDKKGVTLPGVSVLVEGTKNGTITNINGQYTLSVPNRNVVLVFSSIGFLPEKVKVNGRSQVDVSLTEDSKTLSEVIVVGFGTQKKESMVGAIANMDMKELKRAAPSNLTNAIAGRVPGMVVRSMDGAIGGTQNRYDSGTLDDAQFFIRGKATTNGQQPLVLIDGIEGSFSRINPEDIEQFSVLKDASATAVYGVRGANGVILITTKKGSIGAPKINVSSQVRRITPLDFPDFLGSYEYATLFNEARRNIGASEVYTAQDLEHYRTGDSPYSHPDVDWKKLLLKDYTIEHQHIANVSGGTEKVRYYVSGEFNQAGGLFVTAKESEYDYRRFNLRSNLDFTITPTTQFDIKVNARLNDLNFSAKGESSGQRVNATAWGDIVNRQPNSGQLYNPNGTYGHGNGVTGWNSLSDLYESGFITRLQNTLESNFALTQKLDFLTSGLSARGKYAMSYSSGSQKYVYKQPDIWRYDPSDGSYTLHRAATIPQYFNTSPLTNGFVRTQYAEASLNYDRTFAKDHKVTAMGVYIQNTDEGGFALPRSFRGVSGRLTYGYQDKYLIEGNMGYNGSDQFSKGKRYALFPAVALGWVASEEGFMKDNVKVIDFLKIRGSYGEVGNDQIGGFSYLYRYEFGNPPAPGTSNTNPSYYSLGDSPVGQIGLIEGKLGNEDVSWEVARKSNIGIDLRMFKSRLTFTGDLFQEKRDNILAIRNDLPLYTGLLPSKLPALNIGKVTNKGYEMELSFTDKLGDVGFTIGGNYTFVRNNIDYIAETPQKYPYQLEAGNPINTPRGYIWTGKFYDTPDLANPDIAKPVGTVIPGDLWFEDLNDDGVIDADDQKYFGYSDMPEKILGMNLSLNYKGFDFMTFWQGASNVMLRPSGPLSYEFGPNVQPFHRDGRWVYDPARGLDTRATATYPALQPGGSPLTRLSSTFNNLNGEYLRLKTAEIGYTFPESVTKKLRLSNLRVFVNGNNLLTFDHLGKYHIDPEYFTRVGSSNGQGTGAYSPQNKFYAAGLYVTF